MLGAVAPVARATAVEAGTQHCAYLPSGLPGAGSLPPGGTGGPAGFIGG
jgi:hypothetical protein